MAENLDPADSGPKARRVRDDELSGARVTLQVPAVLEYRDLACRAVSSVCKEAFATVGSNVDAVRAAQFTNELMSAVGEAFNNVVIHAYENHGAGYVGLELSWHRDKITVQISDSGDAFDFDSVPSLDLDTPHENGMGIHIIRCFVDDVSYRSGPPNALTLTKLIVTDRPLVESQVPRE